MLKSTFIYSGQRYSVREYGEGFAYDIEDALTGEGAHLTEDDALIFWERLHGTAARFPHMPLAHVIRLAVEGAPMEYRL